ncbi:thermonuclease family protein [Candidatus Poribacteria bacterium]|nr:thermonuclease family protein [Candidatus Poribacteria bacterium]
MVFKIKPDGTFMLSSGEGVTFLGIKIPMEIDVYGKKVLVEYLNKKIFRERVRIVQDADLPDYLNKDNNQNYRAYIYLEDGTFFNAELVKQGLAIVDYSFYYKYQKQLEEFEIQASERKIGLWQIPTMEALTWRPRIPEINELKAVPIEKKEKKENKEPNEPEAPKKTSNPIEDERKKRLSKYIEALHPEAQNASKDFVTTEVIEDKNININQDESISTIKVPLPSSPKTDGNFVGHKKLKIYHANKCEKIKWIKTEKVYFDNKKEAEDEGYAPHNECIFQP